MKPHDLTLDERCRVLGGASAWLTHPVDRVGLPAIKMSDGPNGVRGDGANGLTPGVVVPTGIALGSTWDPALVERIGDLLGKEAERRNVHVLLGPTVNLMRTPIGGRTFECYSEDPELSARLAVGWVRGVQSHDVAVTVKHFVANDSEIERMTVDARLAESTLRELYLRPFEAAVIEANAWGIMSAYNQVDGRFCAENPRLLREILRDEWGFDGVVVSDWGGAHDTVLCAEGGLTIAMPGPRSPYGDDLLAAVERAAVDEVDVDARVEELLRLVDRTHAVERLASAPEQSVDHPDERALCREAAVASIVLVRNLGDALPLAADAVGSVAVIGQNAAETRTMGGGSSALNALPSTPILDALRDRLGADRVTYAKGVSIDKMLPTVRGAQLRRPDGGEGLLVEHRDGADVDRPIVATGTVGASVLTAFGSVPDGIEGPVSNVTLVGEVVPERSGRYRVGGVLSGKGRITFGDTVVVDDPERRLPRGEWLFGYGCEEQTVEVDLEAGVPVPLRMATTLIRGFGAISFGMTPVDSAALLDDAVAAAEDADVAVVVVGTTDQWETEGVDRTTIALPGEQDELVRRVAATATPTVVVVNAGAPVAMPWADEVDAIVVAYFAGQETGPAVAAVLTGDADPGGRLPVTYPRRLEDTPAWPHYRPVDGVQTYGEGRFIGYRGHEANGVAPQWPFGHGLSYGTSTWSDARLSTAEVAGDGRVTVSVDVANTGDRPATDVVQVYVTSPNPDLPPKVLAGFAKVHLEPGESTTSEVALGPVAWRRWDDDAHQWTVDAGAREVVVAASATDERFRLPLRVG